MKNYIKIVVVINFIVGSHSYSDASSAAQNPIVSTTTGDNSLVEAIKQYSNITEADVNKYKLLWLGWFGAVPVLAMGGGSLYGGQKVGGMAFDYVTGFDLVKEKLGRFGAEPKVDQSSIKMISDLLKTRTPWMAAAAIGAGFLSYKLFYPRIRQGVLNKVQNFIDVCRRLTFATQNVGQESSTWGEWVSEESLKICLALDNLKQQAYYANTLLNQVGVNDNYVKIMQTDVNTYLNNLKNNSSGCGHMLAGIQTQKNAALQQQGLESQILGQKIQNVKNVVSIVEKVGSGIFNFVRDVANFGIQNKEPLGMLGAGYWLYKTFSPARSSAQ